MLPDKRAAFQYITVGVVTDLASRHFVSPRALIEAVMVFQAKLAYAILLHFPMFISIVCVLKGEAFGC